VESHLGANVVGSGVKMDKFTVEVEVAVAGGLAGVSGGSERCSTVAGPAYLYLELPSASTCSSFNEDGTSF
jgi:hypothetical protein